MHIRQYVTLLVWVVSVNCEMEGFIVGGSFAAISKHPHSAFLNINCVTKSGEHTQWICGSSVVNQRILLSAGHCLFTCTAASHITINLGNEHKDRGAVYTVYSFMVHEYYNKKTSANDIAMLRVLLPLQFSANVSRVALMKSPPYTENAQIAGWGVTDEQRLSQSNRLKFVTQQVWVRNNCLRIFGFLPTGTICASAKNAQDYAAQGDSGSALVVRGYIQIGLVSYKIPSISSNIIVYTDVGYFYDWIRNNAKRLYCLN